MDDQNKSQTTERQKRNLRQSKRKRRSIKKIRSKQKQIRERERENRTVAILVEQAEGFLKLRDLVIGELVCHFFFFLLMFVVPSPSENSLFLSKTLQILCPASWPIPFIQSAFLFFTLLPFSFNLFTALLFSILFIYLFTRLFTYTFNHMIYLISNVPY